MAKVNITTFDNPFNPFTQFEDWFRFDEEHDYGTCSLLDQFCFTSDQLSDSENDEELERAIDEIIAHDVRKIYKKVILNSEEPEHLEE